jgi:hypothetical protein
MPARRDTREILGRGNLPFGLARKIWRFMSLTVWYLGAVPAWYVFCFPVVVAWWLCNQLLQIAAIAILGFFALAAVDEGWKFLKKIEWSRPAPVIRYETNVIIDRDFLDGGARVYRVPSAPRGYGQGYYNTGYYGR